jgi:adenine-specific DNA-methyltransferase
MNVEPEYKAQVAEGRFWFGPDGKGVPRRKTYLSERDGKSAWTWWPNSEVGHTQEGTREVRALFDKDGPTLFDFPKPVRLLQRIVQLATHPDREEIVLDFFAGSGTMAHAVLAQNALDGGGRQFVVVQLDEALDPKSDAFKAGYATIAEISRDRIRRAGDGLLDAAGLAAGDLDVGYRTLKVDTTNMVDVLRTPDDVGQQVFADLEESVKADRSGEDLLFQVLIDWGLELTMPIGTEKLDGREVFVVEDDALIACFAMTVSPVVVREIAERKPLRAVFRDSSFDSDAARINAEQIFSEISPTTEFKAI